MEIRLDDIVPEVVFKYRSFKKEEHKRIITHQEIYFAKPSEFLDPYDCKFTIDREYVKNEINRRKYYCEFLGISNLYHPYISELIKENPITDELLDKTEIERAILNDNIYGVFSASETSRSEHLWKIFGDNHKGFCVGLDFKAVFPHTEGMKGKVDYVEIDKLPKCKVLNHENFIESVKYTFDSILTLPIAFIDEQEYRIQKLIFDERQRKKQVDKENIKSITLGYKMSTNQKNEIIDLVKKHLPGTIISQLKYQKNGILKEVIIE